MERGGEVNVREDSKPPLLIHIGWIGINLRETLKKPMVFQDCLDEKEVGIAHHPQLTPKPTKNNPSRLREIKVFFKILNQH